MTLRNLGFAVVAIVALALGLVPVSRAQEAQAPPGGREGARRGEEGRGRGVFGKISAMTKDSMEVTGGDGTKVSVKLTSGTEFRKERQPAKIGDFKVGDSVIVRIDPDSAAASGATALVVASAPQGFTGHGGGGGGQGFMQGTMGKDFVAGEVESVDAPKLTVVRVDNVTQTLELNEETSLRRGRDSITMADIQPGDHIMARGAVANDVFIPKSVNVISPEQWKRMREFMNEGQRPAGGTPRNAAPPATQQKPPEQPR